MTVRGTERLVVSGCTVSTELTTHPVCAGAWHAAHLVPVDRIPSSSAIDTMAIDIDVLGLC